MIFFLNFRKSSAGQVVKIIFIKIDILGEIIRIIS